MFRPLALATLALLGSTGCAARHAAPADTPTAVLRTYLEHESQGRFEQAHALLTAVDRSARPLPAYVSEHVNAGAVWLAVAHETRFTVGPVAPTEEGAPHVTVPVRAQHARFSEVTPLTEQLPADVALGDAVAALVDALQREPIPTDTEQLSYALRMEDDGWRVWLGLAEQDQAVAAFKAVKAAFRSGDAEAAATSLARLEAVEDDPSGVVEALTADARDLVDALARTTGSPPAEADETEASPASQGAASEEAAPRE